MMTTDFNATELKRLYDASRKGKLTFDAEYDHVHEVPDDDEEAERLEDECTKPECVQYFGLDPLIGFYDDLPDDVEQSMADLEFIGELWNAFPAILAHIETLEKQQQELTALREFREKALKNYPGLFTKPVVKDVTDIVASGTKERLEAMKQRVAQAKLPDRREDE